MWSSGLTACGPAKSPPTRARVGAVVAGSFSASAITVRSPGGDHGRSTRNCTPQRRGRDRACTAASTPRPRGRPQPVAPSQRLRPSAALPAWNRERIDLVSELRCECGQPTCTDTVPAVAETHRGSADRFLVTPAHFAGGVVVRAADCFFVVDSGGRSLPQAQGSLR